MPQERYNHLLMKRGGRYGWEAMINPYLKIADLDENAIIGAVREGHPERKTPGVNHTRGDSCNPEKVQLAS